MDIIESQLYYSDRVMLAMMLESGFQTHSQASTLVSMLMQMRTQTQTLSVNRLSKIHICNMDLLDEMVLDQSTIRYMH